MTTTNLQNGLTTASENETLGGFILPDPSTAFTFIDDFSVYNASEWAFTASSSAALIDGVGGILQHTFAATSFRQITSAARLFQPVFGKQIWFKTRLATATGQPVGFTASSIPTLGLFSLATDAAGIYFTKDASTEVMELRVSTTGSSFDSVTFSTPGAFTTAGQFDDFSYHYDGNETIKVYLNDNEVAKLTTDKVPFDLILSLGAKFDIDDNQTKIDYDYFYAAQER